MAEPWLRLDLSVQRGSRILSFRLESGSRAIGVSGPSGVGKTTLIRALAGLEPAAKGSLRVFGELWQEGDSFVPAWRRGVGWVPQEASLFPHLSVRENLAYAQPGAKELLEIAERLGIGSLLDRLPRRLSGGERQRVALGRVMLARPRLLLLDEPFSALDRPLRADVCAELDAWCARHEVPRVVVSHDEADLVTLSSERWEFVDGILCREERR